MLVLALFHCAQSQSWRETLMQRQAQSRPRAATYGTDDFYGEPNYRENEHIIPTDHFFFKKCRIKTRLPYPDHHQWECSSM